MIKVLQDQQEIIQKQEAKINSLNSEIEKLGALKDRISLIEKKLETSGL